MEQFYLNLPTVGQSQTLTWSYLHSQTTFKYFTHVYTNLKYRKIQNTIWVYKYCNLLIPSYKPTFLSFSQVNATTIYKQRIQTCYYDVPTLAEWLRFLDIYKQSSLPRFYCKRYKLLLYFFTFVTGSFPLSLYSKNNGKFR